MDILYGIVKAMWVVWMKLTGIYKKKKKIQYIAILYLQDMHYFLYFLIKNEVINICDDNISIRIFYHDFL